MLYMPPHFQDFKNQVFALREEYSKYYMCFHRSVSTKIKLTDIQENKVLTCSGIRIVYSGSQHAGNGAKINECEDNIAPKSTDMARLLQSIFTCVCKG